MNDDPEYCSAVALRDLGDIEAAQMVISFTEDNGGGKGGRHVELGVAIGLRKFLIVCGPREHVFHTAPGTGWFPDWPHLAMYLRRLGRPERREQ